MLFCKGEVSLLKRITLIILLLLFVFEFKLNINNNYFYTKKDKTGVLCQLEATNVQRFDNPISTKFNFGYF